VITRPTTDASGPRPRPTVERLAADLTERGVGDPLTDEFVTWLSGSSRFRGFADTYRDKIRKKLRNATDPATVRDVRAEILAARLLLADRRFDVRFEAYGSGKGGPDLTLTFRGNETFDIEVTRLRRIPDAAGLGATIMAKLRQLTPSTPNLLLLAADAECAAALDVAGAVRGLRGRADAKGEAFFIARGFEGSRAFYDRFLRLSAVLVWCEAADDDRATLWTNGSARIPLSDDAARACLASLRAAM